MIALREYETTEASLDEEDLRWLIETAGRQFTIQRTLGGAVTINPNQFVGVMTLPSGATLSVRPKVPASNLFVMLATAYRLGSPFLDRPASYDTIDEVLEFLVDEFIHLVEERIAAGLHRNYVEREENLAAVRGRILIPEDLRQNHVLRQRVFCRFTEFSWDIPENQVIRQVAHLLAGWVDNPRRRLRLWQIDHLLGEVSPVEVPEALLGQFVYGRLNADYEPIHHLCRLFLHGASVSEHAGSTGFRSFLLDMNRLFEQFVTEILHLKTRPGMHVTGQHTTHLDDENRLEIQPDLLVMRHGRPALVADCKYKRLNRGDFRNHDVYQAVAYCTALGLDRGMLIYPKHEWWDPVDLLVRNSGIVIRQTAIDLGGAPANLRAASDALAGSVFDWAAA